MTPINCQELFCRNVYVCSYKLATLVLTGGQLHPRADLVDAPRVAEEEEAEADDAAHHQQHGDPHEEHGRLEGAGRDGAEVQRAPFAGELRGERVPDAVVEEAEISGLRRVDAVPDPVRLDEHHHGDYGERDGENRPQHTHGPSVTHVVGVVDFSGLLSREHGDREGFLNVSWMVSKEEKNILLLEFSFFYLNLLE